MFAEYLSQKLLLRLPHRMVTFAIPKMLRVFFRHDRKLFAELSILIFELVQEFFNEAAGTAIENGAILAYQTFGQFLRWNPHVHAIILEGGFDSAGRFIHIPFGEPSAMTECFRRRVIRFFLDRKLIAELFSPTDFIAELTQRVPPRGVQYIRRCGLYSSRGRGVWKTKPHLVPLAAEGGSQIDAGLPASPQPQPSIPTADSKSAWAPLIAKIYEVDPLTCASCGSPMRIVAVITDTAEVKRILRHLVNIGKPPLGLNPARLN